MSTTSAGDGRATLASPSRRISNRQLVLMSAPATVLVVFMVASLVAVYGPQFVFTVLGFVPPDMVEASAAANGRTLARHRISDARTVSELYARINRLPSSFRGVDCGLDAHPDPVAYTYTFRFMRGTTLIEVASTTASRECDGWTWEVARGGYSELQLDLTGAATPPILAEAHLPLLP